MNKNRFSYIIISILLIIVLVSVIPFKDSFKSNATIGVIEIKSPIIDSKKIDIIDIIKIMKLLMTEFLFSINDSAVTTKKINNEIYKKWRWILL